MARVNTREWLELLSVQEALASGHADSDNEMAVVQMQYQESIDHPEERQTVVTLWVREDREAEASRLLMENGFTIA